MEKGLWFEMSRVILSMLMEYPRKEGCARLIELEMNALTSMCARHSMGCIRTILFGGLTGIGLKSGVYIKGGVEYTTRAMENRLILNAEKIKTGLLLRS